MDHLVNTANNIWPNNKKKRLERFLSLKTLEQYGIESNFYLILNSTTQNTNEQIFQGRSSFNNDRIA